MRDVRCERADEGEPAGVEAVGGIAGGQASSKDLAKVRPLNYLSDVPLRCRVS
jgi:hypothetical protein